MSPVAVVTIVSNNYLHFARTLMQSVAAQHPEADRYCVIVDRDPAPAAELADSFTVLPMEQLNLPDGDEFLYRYNVLELNTAVKPWALETLLARGYRDVLYIDPDIWLYRPLTDVFAMLDAGASVVLTPHLLAPVTDEAKPGELDVRRSGTYNLGFCALRQSPATLDMLHWWQAKLRHHCIIAHDRGIFVDQSWMDLVPGLFPEVGILRHPGYNVAYWNIAQRPVVAVADGYQVLGETLYFFHFSGLNPLAPEKVSKYQNRYTLDEVTPATAEIIRDYCARVIANGIEHYRELPYAFGVYSDGHPIANEDRIRYRENPDLQAKAHGRPFACRHLLAAAVSEAGVPVAPPRPDTDRELITRIYRHFLARDPEDEVLARSRGLADAPASRQWRIVLAVATSPEARRRAGWFTRLLAWPMAREQQPVSTPAPAAPPVVRERPPTRPSPYGGLHSAEPASAVDGIWVAPRLDLPVCGLSQGHIRIEGTVDLNLLARGNLKGGFLFEIHGPHGLLRSEPVAASGAFALDFTIPTDAFAGGCQWTILSSAHVVPKQAGIGADVRQLAWRVKRIVVDDLCLIDAARSPATLSIDALLPATGINLVGYLAAELGIGEAARSLARACLAADIPFSAVDVGYQTQNRQADHSILTRADGRRFPIDVRYVNADQTPVTAAYLADHGLHADYRIGYWHWEQPELPAPALAAFAHVDEVWVPSTFVHDAVAAVSPVPVVKIPHALEFSPTPGVSRADFGLPAEPLLVLVMYDFHSYQYRKNPQAALAAFRLAAAGRSDVALVIKTINGQHRPAERQALQDSVADLANVHFIDDFLSRQQTWDLQSCCDILLSLHRAEGFGLAPAEMMYLGKPVVATGWSANTDFMTADNSFPVRYTLQPLAEAVGVYPAGQLWAEADVDHAADCLRRLFDDAGLRQRIGEQAARDIRQQLSPQAVGEQIRRRLAMIAYWHPQLRG